MLDIKLIREKPDVVRNNLEKRGNAEKLRMLEELIEDDRRLRALIKKANELKHTRNVITEEIARIKREGKSVEEKIREMRDTSQRIKLVDDDLGKLRERVNYTLMRLPNILHESVPVGKDETDNVEVRVWGSKPIFDFKVKDHVDLGVDLGLIDVERAAKVSGARFFFMKGALALLDLAIMRFAIDFLVRKGFKFVIPPYTIRRKPYEGVTDLADFETMLYKIEGEDLYLIATSEHPMVSMHMDEVFMVQELPVKYVGFSTNFRKEAGTHGKDTKGIFRVHQFNKVEQVILSTPEESWRWHEHLIRNAEEIFQALQLPYRVVNICTGDIGTVAAKKYDLEVWLPGQRNYREVVSCSNCTDYQSRRLNIKYREKTGLPPKDFIHTLNSTGVADRALVAVMENYQRRDGSISVPNVLKPYMDGLTEIL
mgnify:CR=1 FL=1